MASVKVQSIEDMKAGSTFARFTPNNGMLSYKKITRLETKMIRDAATIKCHVPHLHSNLCGPMEQPADYNLQVGTQSTTTPYPGDMPIFLDNCTAE